MNAGLFLHMGPGLNAQVEKSVFAASYPHVEFWDQPKFSIENGAYEKLVKAVVERVNTLSDQNGGKVDLYAHSFGGRLAASALEVVSEKVNTCTFISTGYFFERSFINLSKSLILDDSTSPALKKKIETFLGRNKTSVCKEVFWESVNLCLEDPDFMRLYWANKDEYQWYRKEASQVEGLDFEAFTHVANDFIASLAKGPKQSLFKGEVKILIGDNDPLIDYGRDSKAWRGVFPQAKLSCLPKSGHFIHFEKNRISF